MAELEGPFQTELRKRLELRFPGCIVSKQDSSYRQGIPDLGVFMPNGFFALLEVKRSASAPSRPNQSYYVSKAQEMCFGATVYPENLEEVLDALQSTYESHRQACLLECQ